MNNQYHSQPGVSSSRLSLYDAAVNFLAAKRRKQSAIDDLEIAKEVLILAEKDFVRTYLAEGADGVGSENLIFKAPNGLHYVLELDIEEGVIYRFQEVEEILPSAVTLNVTTLQVGEPSHE